MTTTTFTAPLTLLWVQARILKWMVLLLLLLFAVSIGLGNARSEAGMIGFFLALSFITFLATVSGPLVFGAEFTEGSFDYLATQPVSQRMVFAIKTVVIVVYCLICTYLTRTVMGEDAPNLAIVLFPFYLNVALWCAAATLLTKDTIKGLLYGIVTFIPLVYLLSWAHLLLFSDPIVNMSDRIYDTINISEFHIKFSLVGPVIIVLSPLLFLGILSMANHWRLFQRIGIPLTARLSLTLFVTSLLFAKWILLCDGSAYVSPYANRRGAYASMVEENSLLLLEEGNQPVILSSMPLNGEIREPAIRGMIPNPEDMVVIGALLTKDRVLIHWLIKRGGRRTLLYDISEPQTPTEMGPLNIQGSISHGKYLGNNIFEATLGTDRNDHGMETQVVDIDLSDGSVSAEPPEIEQTTRPVSIPTTSPAAYKEGLIAVCPPHSGFHSIHLGVVTEKGVSRFTPIQIPFNLRVQGKLFGFHLPLLGFPLKGFHEFCLGFAGDYLIAWFEWGRFAIWDVSDPKNPTYLGDAPTPFSFTPQATNFPQFRIEEVNSELIHARSEDGSLVFISTRGGILWLEFPALLKEARKS